MLKRGRCGLSCANDERNLVDSIMCSPSKGCQAASRRAFWSNGGAMVIIHPTFTGTNVIVSLPKMSITFTATV